MVRATESGFSGQRGRPASRTAQVLSPSPHAQPSSLLNRSLLLSGIHLDVLPTSLPPLLPCPCSYSNLRQRPARSLPPPVPVQASPSPLPAPTRRHWDLAGSSRLSVALTSLSTETLSLHTSLGTLPPKGLNPTSFHPSFQFSRLSPLPVRLIRSPSPLLPYGPDQSPTRTLHHLPAVLQRVSRSLSPRSIPSGLSQLPEVCSPAFPLPSPFSYQMALLH